MLLTKKISISGNLLLTCVVFLISSYNGKAQALEETMLPIQHTDARTLSLASSNSSDISSPAIGVLNPASFSIIDQRSIAYNTYHSWSKDLYTLNLDYRTNTINNSSYMLGFQYFDTGLNEVNYLGEPEHIQPDLEGFKVHLGYAYSFSPVFSVGILGTGYTAWNDIKATEHLNFTVGTTYSPTNTLSYSLVVRGLGYGLGYDVLGNGSIIVQNRNLDETIEYGVSMYFPDQSDRQRVTLTAAAEKKILEQGLYYRFGIELMPIDKIAVRSGYLNGQQEQGFTFGVGINISALRISYSVAPDSRFFERTHQIELLVNF